VNIKHDNMMTRWIRAGLVAQICNLSVSLGIDSFRDDFSVRKNPWNSLIVFRLGFWLRLARAALYRRFLTCRASNQIRRTWPRRTLSRLKIGDTADCKSALLLKVILP
jgi:hypothetical protein